MPTIQILAKASESMIVSDPKGELYERSVNMLEKNGYSVHVLNFRDTSRGMRWNPLMDL